MVNSIDNNHSIVSDQLASSRDVSLGTLEARKPITHPAKFFSIALLVAFVFFKTHIILKYVFFATLTSITTYNYCNTVAVYVTIKTNIEIVNFL